MKVSQCWLPRLHSWPHAFNGRESDLLFTIWKVNSRDTHRVDHTKAFFESSFFAFLISLWTCRDRHLIYAITISLDRFVKDPFTPWKFHCWMTCLLPTPSSMGRASLHVRPCIQIYHIPPRNKEKLLLAFMHSRLTSWKVISLYPIPKHWHGEKSGTGLALYYRGLPRILINSYRSKEASNLLRLRPREAIPHSQYPGRQRCRASLLFLFPLFRQLHWLDTAGPAYAESIPIIS